MKILNKIFSREDKIEKEAQTRALEGVIANLFAELGLGEPQATNGDYKLILERLGEIGIGIDRLKSAYFSSRIIEMIREGKKVPKWAQEVVAREIEIKQSQGEAEKIIP